LVRWGILGTGGIARKFASELELTDSGELVAVGSRSLAGAQAFGGGRPHGSYEALVSDAEVDAVYVATPHPLHHANARLALEAGKPVLVEKPFTMNAAEARDLVALARANGLFLMEAMWTRFLPHMAEIRRVLQAGELGDVVTVLADHGQWFALDPAFRLFAPELGGGALLDLGVYPVSFASMVLGTPNRIMTLSTPAFTGVDGQTSILLGYSSGAQSVITCTSSAVSPTKAAIVGTEARIEIGTRWYGQTGFDFIPRRGEPRRYEAGVPSGLRFEADEVARCLEHGLLESPLMPLDETVSIMETMDTVLSASRQAGGTAPTAPPPRD
jgi:predicted dehydrogenase